MLFQLCWLCLLVLPSGDSSRSKYSRVNWWYDYPMDTLHRPNEYELSSSEKVGDELYDSSEIFVRILVQRVVLGLTVWTTRCTGAFISPRVIISSYKCPRSSEGVGNIYYKAQRVQDRENDDVSWDLKEIRWFPKMGISLFSCGPELQKRQPDLTGKPDDQLLRLPLVNEVEDAIWDKETLFIAGVHKDHFKDGGKMLHMKAVTLKPSCPGDQYRTSICTSDVQFINHLAGE